MDMVYRDYNWCYHHYIDLGMSHEEMAEIAGCKKRTIKKWCCQIFRLDTWTRAKEKKLDNIQHDLVIGSLLGDGHIDKREKYPLFIVSHAENQKDYLYYKYEIMKNMCRMKPHEYESGECIICGSNAHRQKSYRFNTGTYLCFDKYRNMTKEEILNELNEYSFAIWILDDGSRCDNIWSLCSANLDNELVVDVLNNKFGIVGRIQKDNRYINFNKVSSDKIDEIILRNIPNDLDIIKYKILERKNNV